MFAIQKLDLRGKRGFSHFPRVLRYAILLHSLPFAVRIATCSLLEMNLHQSDGFAQTPSVHWQAATDKQPSSASVIYELTVCAATW